MYLVASLLVLALLTFLFADALEQQRNPNESPHTVTTAAGDKSIALRRNRDGHYVLDGYLNDSRVEFLLDTGATAVSIPAHIAQSAALTPGPPIRALTANGMTTAYATRVAKITIGDIAVADVAASIVPNLPGDQILLGMSFLKQLDFAQRGDTLILSQRRGR